MIAAYHTMFKNQIFIKGLDIIIYETNYEYVHYQ